MRSMAATLGLTERPAATVFADLRAAVYITVRRRARRDRRRRVIWYSKTWRECMGVEPTRDGYTAPQRF